MAIPPVNLNVDPSGYAGSLVRDLRAPSIRGPRRSTGLSSFLKKQSRLRNRLAEAQLKLLKQQLSERRAGLREDERSRRRQRFDYPSLNERRAEEAGVRAAGAQAEMGRQAARRAGGENAARERFLGLSGQPFPSGPLGFQRSNLLQALSQMSGGRGGQAYFQPSIDERLQGFQKELELGKRYAPEPEPGPAGMSGSYDPNYRVKGVRNVVPGFRGGSLPGTLKTDQKARLHEGEVVLSADQVDEPLMAYLIGDKLRKLRSGQMNGRGTGPGTSHQKGTLPSYQRGTMGYATTAVDPRLAAALGLDIIPGSPERDLLGPEGDAPRAAGPEMMRTPFSVTPRDDLSENPIWRVLSGVFGKMTPEERARMRASAPDDPRFREPEPEPPPEALRNLPTEAEPLPLEPSGPGLEEALGPMFRQTAERDLDVALQRVRRGDMGSAVNPLTLRGDPTAAPKPAYNSPVIRGGSPDADRRPEDRAFAPEEPLWRRAEHERFMEISNRSKAERIQDYLASRGGEIDPDQARQLEQQAKFYERQSDTIRARAERKREQFESRREELQKAWADYQQQAVKQSLESTEAARQQQRETYEKMQDKIHEMHLEIADDEADAATRRNLAKLVSRYVAMSNPQVPDAETYFEYLVDEYGL